MPTEASVDTADLTIAYREYGPPDGAPVVLVHGFPDDARTWDPLAESLAADGYHALAPYVRGFGPTQLREGVARTGEVAALARDVLAFADALRIETFHLVCHDWGARAGYAAAVLAPERLRTLTTLAVPYGTNQSGQRMSIAQTRAYWYQWYFATDRGRDELASNRAAFCRELWRLWSPGWSPTDDEYARTAASFDNPAFVDVVISSYRQRWGNAAGAPAYAADRERLAPVPPIGVATLALLGAGDGATLAESSRGAEAHFTGRYVMKVLAACGHFVQRERPAAVREELRAQLR